MGLNFPAMSNQVWKVETVCLLCWHRACNCTRQGIRAKQPATQKQPVAPLPTKRFGQTFGPLAGHLRSALSAAALATARLQMGSRSAPAVPAVVGMVDVLQQQSPSALLVNKWTLSVKSETMDRAIVQHSVDQIGLGP